jgi:predicted transcriptional regulator of viral defense system
MGNHVGMPRPDIVLANLAAQHHGILTDAQIKSVGLTRSQYDFHVRQGAWTRLFDGVYRHASIGSTWESDLFAACLTGGEGTIASHRSAARLYGLAGGTDELIEITCRRWRRSRYPTLVVHETKAMDAADFTSVDGIPTSTVERTLLDLGAVKGPLTVRMAFDRAVSTGLTTWSRVDRTLRRLAKSGRPGVTRLRAVLELRSPERRVPESERETLLLELMARFGLPAPVPQVEVRDDDGRLLARVDAGYPEHRIAIEYDSDSIHTEPDALARDNQRRNRLIAAGWTVIAARNQDLTAGGHEFCGTVAAALNQALAS